MKSSNFSLERIAFHGRLFLVLFAMTVICSSTFGGATEGQEKSQAQYARTRWGADRGFPGGEVYAITQTADGVLWVGTEKGLVRFDGINFRLTQESGVPGKPIGPVLGLQTDSEGNLIVRHQGPNLMTYRKRNLQELSLESPGPEVVFTAMTKGQDGSLLLSTLGHGTLRYEHGVFSVLATRSNLPNFIALAIAQAADGRVWMGSRDAGLFRVEDGHTLPVLKETHDLKINCLLPAGEQDLWMGTDNGVVRWNGKDFIKTGLPPILGHLQVLAMIKDRQSNIWLGTSSGLVRIDRQGSSTLYSSDRGSTGSVTAVFEDREGNIWVGTAGGIERLRESVFKTYAPPESFPTEINGPVYVDAERRAWFAPATGGLLWLRDGHVAEETREALHKDVIYSIAGAREDLWVGRQRGGLTHLYSQNGAPRSKTYTETDGLSQNSVYAINLNRDGTVWAGTLNSGVSRLSGGRFTTFTTSDGLLSNTIFSIYEAASGTMWFGTPNGLSSFANDRWKTYTVREGLPANDVNCMTEDSEGTLWIGTGKGLAALRADRIGTREPFPASLREPIFGIQTDRFGDLWIATASRVVRADPRKLLSAEPAGAVREYEIADGLPGTQGVKRDKSVTGDPFGHVWFSVSGALSVVDPVRARNGSVPALVHVEQISADGKGIDVQESVRIPAHPQRVSFRYEGLSLAVPERIRFRYKLEGFEEAWSEPVNTREVSYTNLPFGSYRFVVSASNSDGNWNSADAGLGFEIARAFWQTWWFRLASVFATGLLVLLLVRLRVLQLTRQMNMRFEERLAERTRIAQELHDTLLQGFLSASMQLHVADDRLANDSPAKPLVGRILQLMSRVIEEGRNAVKGLRYSNPEWRTLEGAFSHVQLEMSGASSTEFRIIVEGTARPLKSILRDEVYLIGREALVNAFRHSQSNSVEVEIDYGNSNLRVVVRDNGRGIDELVLRSGREGHWGLSGMRERAERIGAKLRVLSRADAGTEIELTVPGRIAFESATPSGSQRWLSRWQQLRRVRTPKLKNEQHL
ncbi:MAG TPA: two-component regulator propeller domain-containing protein [Candidatus Saccharimonadales bacterium]|nr:two-component regulator propeller domain-containing protein [Candidatus Saccharimonadales bacterium]